MGEVFAQGFARFAQYAASSIATEGTATYFAAYVAVYGMDAFALARITEETP